VSEKVTTAPRAGATTTGGGEAAWPWWSALTRWRDWNLPVKLSAVILVPVVFAVVLGAITIGGQIDTANSFRGVDRLVAVNDDLRKVLTWLQRERTKAATLLTGGSRDIAFELTAEQRSADAARTNLVRSVERAEFANTATSDRYNAVGARMAELDVLREKVAEREVNGAQALKGYTTAIRALLAFDRAATEEIADPGLSGTAGALHDLEAAKEEVYYQQALVAMGIARGGLTGSELDALRASQARLEAHVVEFRAVATPEQQAEYDRMLDAPGVDNRIKLLRLVLGDADTLLPVGVPLPITSVDWNGASELTSGRISNVSGTLGREITTRSAALQDEASDGAGAAAVVLTIALVIAAAVITIIGRQLLTSLRVLRREAFRIADEALPAAVERIRGGKNLPVEPEVTPVPITTGDEVGEVARAFDAVHRQALKLATEQAGLRANYSDVFVNLSRRSQGLVQRQLHLLERLERDEEDADQLAVLFQLDHLATRMRRNNENLMVLSGADLARRGTLPAPLGDLLRAAVSEIEQYQRVVIQPPAEVKVVGYAVSDLVRLTAELLDNAAAFSAPATQVTVSSHHTPGGAIRVEIADRGIGLTPSEIADANARLADSGAVDASTSRRMGLFVVGRLATRLGVRVWLEPAVGQGTRAIITVPAELCASPEPARPRPPALPPAPVAQIAQAVPAPRPQPTPRSEQPEALPRRTASNGHPTGTAPNGHTTGVIATGTPPATAPNGHTTGTAANGTTANGTTANGTADTTANGVTDTATTGHTAATTKGHTAGTATGATSNGHTAGTTSGTAGGKANGATGGKTTNGKSTNGSAHGKAANGKSANGKSTANGRSTANGKAPANGKPTTNDAPTNGASTNRASANGPATNGPSTNGSATNGAAAHGHDGASAPSSDPLAPWSLNETTMIHGPSTAELLEQLSRGDAPASGPARQDTPSAPPVDPVPAPRPSTEPSDREPSDSESVPLPRRAPRPAPAAEQTAEMLFTPADPEETGWWVNTLVQKALPAVPPLHETTPIFDEMASAWFRAVTDTPDNAWDFAADTGFRTANSVSSAEADEYTETGLPRRTPRRNLVPGSVGPAGLGSRLHHRPSFAQRDAHDLRDRLSSYQRGVHRARGVHHTGPAHAEDDSLDLTGARWRFAADVGWQAAESVATSAAPVATTDTGLPRRTPRERLLPGSMDAAVAPQPGGKRTSRDAEALRSRLAGFQRGLDRGRDSLTQRVAPVGPVDHPADHQGDGDA
jgi:signal transduction histidine kinase